MVDILHFSQVKKVDRDVYDSNKPPRGHFGEKNFAQQGKLQTSNRNVCACVCSKKIVIRYFLLVDSLGFVGCRILFFLGITDAQNGAFTISLKTNATKKVSQKGLFHDNNQTPPLF